MTTLEKIRAEIEEDSLLYNTNITLHDNEGQYVISASEYVLQIIDKYAEQGPCKDAISREWLKTAIHNFYYGLKHTPTEEDIQAYIDATPSVTPQEPKTGHWIEDKTTYAGQGMGNYKCSVCDRINGSWIKDMPSVYPNFCWWCGARMVEPQESEDKE